MTTHIESLFTPAEQDMFNGILSVALYAARDSENASRAWAGFLTQLALEYGPMEAAKRLGTAIARSKTAVIRTTEGGDDAIDCAMAANDLATNWARKILRRDYKLALKLSKPKRNKVLAGGDEYRLLEVEEVNPGRGHVVTPPEAKVAEPEPSEGAEEETGVRIDPKDLDALLNLAISVHGLDAITYSIARRHSASPEVAMKIAETFPAIVKTIAKRKVA
jgi:hypothetical protein